MQMEIIARRFTMADEQREVIEEHLEKLERYSPRPIQSVRLVVSHEGGRFTADSVLHLKNHEFRAKEEAMEPEQAVAEMVEALRKQLTKFKGKISGKQKGEEGGLGKAMLADPGPLGDDDESPEKFVLRDMDVDTARAGFAESGVPFLVFRNVETSRVAVIYQRADGELGHMESAE